MRTLNSCLALFVLSSSLLAQKRYVVSPHDEVIPLRKGESPSSIITKRTHLSISSATVTCGDEFVLGYPMNLYPANGNFGTHHKDVIGQWFIAKANGTIDTIFWEALGSVGALDSTVYLRVHNSRIGPAYGPGVRPGPWNPPCQNWGYFINTNDLDQGVAAFPEDATPPDSSSWISTISSGPTTLPPITNALWGHSGYPVIDHANSINAVAMIDGGESLHVSVGQQYFISFRVKGPAGHIDDGRTEWAWHTEQVDNKDENYPSRDWKFYEHDSGPSNCAGVPRNDVKRGWVARGGGDDTLNVAAFNIWYSMTVTTNVPPHVRATNVITTTFDTGPQAFDAIILDCDPENPGRAGVKSALVKWQVNGVAKLDFPLAYLGGDTWEATIPGQPVGSLVSYKVYAEDSTGLSSYGAQISYRVVQASNPWAQIDTAGPCVSKSIRLTGSVIPANAFYLPPTADPSANAMDDGTAGPIDIGSNMPLFGDVARYVWVGINGGIAISKNRLDTVDLNSNGIFPEDWTFPYPRSLRHGGRSDPAGAGRMPGNFIAPLWADFSNGCGRILYQNGYGGDSCLFIVEWDSIGIPVPLSHFCDQATFRVIINKCDGTIEYQYDDLGNYGADSLALVGLQADSTALTVPKPGLNEQPPYIFINQNGFPTATRPRAGWCIKIYQGTISTAVAGWNMVAICATAVNGDYRKTTLFPGATTPAYGWDGKRYEREDTLQQGNCYWMKFTAGQNIGARGGLLHCVIDSLHAGWNTVAACVGVPVPKEAAVVSGTTLTSQFYEYTGAWHALTTQPLTPAHCYWVKAAGTGTLTICGNVPAPEPKLVPQTNYAELNSITIRDNAGRYQTLYLGEEGSVKEPLSFHELPPAAPEFDARFASQRMVETYPAHLAEKATYEYPIQIDASAYPLTVTWNTVKPAERKLVLSGSDGNPGNTILDGSGSVRIANANVKSLVVKLQNVEVPKTFALGQNYPNPFNPKTDFRWQISDRRFVSIVVFDILGRKVVTLVDEEKPAGYYTIEWDGRDAHGINVPTGIYFVRMTAGDFNTTRKLMLMK